MAKGYVYKSNHQGKVLMIANSHNPVGIGDTILKELSERAHKNGFGTESDKLSDEMRALYDQAEKVLGQLRAKANELHEFHLSKVGQ